MFHFSRPAIVRVGVFMGFVGTFFLAFATNSPILLIGVGLSSFIVITTPTIQSIILSLVEPEQVGTAVGFMAAMQGFAESALVNIILLVYNKTKHIMNGFCFFTLSFLLGINLVIAMFYTHPQTTREDRNPLTTDDDTPGSPIVPSSDVLKGGVPKASTTPDGCGQSERTSPDNIYAADPLPASEA
ncbi:proton-coupled folate transporter-like isoform X2 [Bolinopsis microptera]|uniref:proton-coupled folate transporter-like isoform X2 n=1 Tax=Bolinopsis microptera TaxID=2820187 RepID=UPI0030799E0D